MITIHVDRGLDKPYAKAYWDRVDWRNKLPHVDSEYACGRYPPNYPMPAIRTKVTWGGTFWHWLTIVELSTPFNRVIRYWEDSPDGFTRYR